MDPLSALGVAAAAVQFLQFGSSLGSKSGQIYTQGALLDHVEFEKATQRLLELTSGVKASIDDMAHLGNLSTSSRKLQEICANCIKLSGDLLTCLKGLKVDKYSKFRRWQSFRQALKSVYSKDVVDKLAARLVESKDELNLHLIVSITDKATALSSGQEEVVQALNRIVELNHKNAQWAKENAQKMVEALLENRALLKRDLSMQNKDSIFTSNEQHEKTRSTLLLALGEAQAVEVALLQSLRFPTMFHRYHEIPEAHRETFRWILETNSGEQQQRWSNFTEWLERDNGIYWINGKAGSGKSTLMRYIFDNPTTVSSLRIWANDYNPQIAGFFFWNGGTCEQRSQAGLLRSLLYQALHRQPDLVRQVFPEEWAEGSHVLAKTGLTVWEWSLTSLTRAFKRWIDLATISSKLCFFIDGLDEYEGDKDEIADFFKMIVSSHSSHVKFCVSSRPWLVFEDVFHGLPGLRLQDLTEPDIEAYIYAELKGHHRMKQLEIANPEHAAQLVNEMVTKASGVFLWVMLVVRSLLTGLRNRDGVSDLLKRLRDLPSDLSSFYRLILKQVDSIYKEQASRTFQIFVLLQRTEGSEKPISAIHVQLAITATPQQMAKDTWDYMKTAELRSRWEQLDTHLKSRCAGLLEIHSSRPWFKGESVHELKVVYLHRTVRDFLSSEDIRAILLEDSGHNYNPSTPIIMSCAARLKRLMVALNIEDIREIILLAFRYAKISDAAGDKTYVQALDGVQDAGLQLWNDSEFWLDPSRIDGQIGEYSLLEKPRRWQRIFLGEATAQGLCSYVRRWVERDQSLLSSGRRLTPLLTYVFLLGTEMKPVAHEMVKMLLKYGADPNELYAGNSPWQHALTMVHSFDWVALDRIQSDKCNTLLGYWAQTFNLLLRSGASHSTTCKMNHQVCDIIGRSRTGKTAHTVKSVIADVFDVRLPSAGVQLRHILESLEEQLECGRPPPIGTFFVNQLPRQFNSAYSIQPYTSLVPRAHENIPQSAQIQLTRT